MAARYKRKQAAPSGYEQLESTLKVLEEEMKVGMYATPSQFQPAAELA